jgi:phosphatidylinositol glycan class B
VSEQNLGIRPERDRRFIAIAALVLIAAALPRFWAAWFDQGLFWPDEIFQSLEQAHRLLFGYGIVPWEFRIGARSWVFPGLIAGLMEIGSWFGLTTGQGLVLWVKTSMALFSLLGVYLSMRFAYQLSGPLAAALAGAFGGFFSVSLLLSSRCSSEMVSGPVLLAAFMLSRRSGRLRQLSAGALASLSIYLRYQNGLIAVGLLGILIYERRFKDALEYSAAAAFIGVLGGLLDWLTWGQPFHALLKYVYFNLYKSAKKYGAFPFTFYARVAWASAGPASLIIVTGFLLSVRRAPLLWGLVAGYVLVHCIVPHKEFRFLMPIAPFGFALAGVGIADALSRSHRKVLIGSAVALVCVVSMSFYTTRLTWKKLGFPSDRGMRSPWHSGEGINRLLWSLGTTPDVCGVIVTGESFGWIGGYSYFHRDVNMYPDAGESELRAANYLIALAANAPPESYRKVEQIREFALFKRAGGCAPAPVGYERALPF